MNFKPLLALIGAMLFGAGIVLAISGASPSAATQSRWSGNTSGNVTTEGGNITQVTISAATLTDRWAAFWGNVSGTIVLGNTTKSVYNWSVTTPGSGKICVSTGSALAFTSLSAATATGINTAFGLGSAADNATNTFVNQTCNVTIVQGSITNTANTTTTGGFNTCAITSGGTAKDNYAFCTALNSTGQNYVGQTVQYQLIVPTNNSVNATETYFFYLELS